MIDPDDDSRPVTGRARLLWLLILLVMAGLIVGIAVTLAQFIPL